MKHKFAQAVLWLTVAEIVYNISGYVVHAITGRILGPEAYGRYGLVITLTTMVIVLVGNGIPTSMSKYLSGAFETAPEKIYGIRRAAFLLQAVLMSSLTILFYLSAPLIATLLGDESLTPLFRLSALVIPTFAAASFNLYFFIGLHFFRVQAILKILRSLARVIFIASLAAVSGTWGAITGNILAPLAVFVVGLIAEPFLVRHYFPAALKKEAPLPHFPWQSILAHAWPLTLFLLFYELILTIDLYLVKILLANDYLTGIYNAAITVGRIPYYLFYALAIALLPAIARTEAHAKKEETRGLITQSLRLMLFLLVPLVILLSRYAPETLHLFYGNHFLDAAPTMSIFVIGVGALTVFYVLTFALNGAGMVRFPMWLALIGLIVSVILNFLLIPIWGLVGSAVAVTVTSIFLMLGILITVFQQFRVALPLRTLGFTTLGALLIVVFSNYLPRNQWFLISSALLTLGYLLFLWFTGVMTAADIAPLRKLLLREKKALEA